MQALTNPTAQAAPSRHRYRRPWSASELQVLYAHYLTEGAHYCHALLPGRDLRAVYTKAISLGLRRQKEHSATKESSEYIDAAIRRFYGDVQPRGAATALAKRLGVTRQWLTTRAATLGVLPTTQPDSLWTPEELALLEEHATKKAERIASIFRRHGHHRTASAIGIQLRLRGIERWDPDVFSATELARCMGVDTHLPLRWIEGGKLKAKRVEEGPVGRTAAWEIRRKDLREFLIQSADWDHRRCPRAWLVDILTGA